MRTTISSLLVNGLSSLGPRSQIGARSSCRHFSSSYLRPPVAAAGSISGASVKPVPSFELLSGLNQPHTSRVVAVSFPKFSREYGSVAAKYESESSEEDNSSKQEKQEKQEMVLSEYWGIIPKKMVDESGRPWPWNSFRPTDAYTPDLSIDLKKHHRPDSLVDKIAYWTVKTLRLPTDIFFQRRYGCRAMMLETVAAVPGMVGGMLLHFKSLRRFEHSGGWIKALLEEAENERMHLMTFMEVVQPKWYERALVFAVQGVFFNAYFLGYVIFPRLAHRIVGYLEEEAIHSYTEFLKEIDKGTIPNTPAPAIARDYWRLPKDATIRDVVEVIRADEAHHRDVNHFAADIHKKHKELRAAPAPLGYH